MSKKSKSSTTPKPQSSSLAHIVRPGASPDLCSDVREKSKESARGQAHSPAVAGLSRWIAHYFFREVLECGCPLPLLRTDIEMRKLFFSVALILLSVSLSHSATTNAQKHLL